MFTPRAQSFLPIKSAILFRIKKKVPFISLPTSLCEKLVWFYLWFLLCTKVIKKRKKPVCSSRFVFCPFLLSGLSSWLETLTEGKQASRERFSINSLHCPSTLHDLSIGYSAFVTPFVLLFVQCSLSAIRLLSTGSRNLCVCIPTCSLSGVLWIAVSATVLASLKKQDRKRLAHSLASAKDFHFASWGFCPCIWWPLEYPHVGEIVLLVFRHEPNACGKFLKNFSWH